MKINKLLIILSLAVTTFLVSCEDYEDTVESSPTVSADNASVRFAAENPTQYEFSPLDLGFNLTIKRSSSSSALEVPISIITNTDNSFTIPSSLSFAAGEETAILAIAIDYSNASFATALEIGIKLGDDHTNPYLVEHGEYYATIEILNWEKYSTGTFTSALFGPWTQDLYKLEGEDRYRFFDLYADGYDFNFTWDGGAALSFPDLAEDDDGYFIWETGASATGFGYFFAALDSSPSYTFYDDASSTFQIEGYWTATENPDWGGWLDDFYAITELH